MSIERDIEIVENLINGVDVEIVNNKGYGSFDTDAQDALSEILDKYHYNEEEIEEQKELIKYAIKHIKKLEKMLDGRGVKYKNFESVAEDNYLYY